MEQSESQRRTQIRITGHRGAAGIMPENTIAGFRLAAELGCNSVEFDVQLSRDGKLVVIHDPTIDRTTNGSGKVSDLYIDDICRFDAGGGEKVPSLSDVLEFVRKTRMDVQIELKADGTEQQAVELVHSYGMVSRARFTCFDHNRLCTVKAISPDIHTGILLDAVPADPLKFFQRAGIDFCHLNEHAITGDVVQFLHHHSIPVVAFGKITDIATVDRLGSVEFPV